MFSSSCPATPDARGTGAGGVPEALAGTDVEAALRGDVPGFWRGAADRAGAGEAPLFANAGTRAEPFGAGATTRSAVGVAGDRAISLLLAAAGASARVAAAAAAASPPTSRPSAPRARQFVRGAEAEGLVLPERRAAAPRSDAVLSEGCSECAPGVSFSVSASAESWGTEG